MTAEILRGITERTLEVKSIVCIDDQEYDVNNKSFDIEYYLLEGEYEGIESEFKGTRVYGIEVVKKIMDKVVEQESITDFSTSRSRTIDAMKLLGECKVTPATFKDILEDLIAE